MVVRYKKGTKDLTFSQYGYENVNVLLIVSELIQEI